MFTSNSQTKNNSLLTSSQSNKHISHSQAVAICDRFEDEDEALEFGELTQYRLAKEKLGYQSDDDSSWDDLYSD